MKIEGYEEITKEEYYNKFLKHEDGLIVNKSSNQLFFKKKEEFPIKIKTKGGPVKIGEDNCIKIYNLSNDSSNIINYDELEEFEEIIKKAKEIRDKNENM